MDYLSITAIVCVAIFMLLGLFRGFWKALSALISLFGAYFASAFWGSTLATYWATFAPTFGLGETALDVLGSVLVFIAVGLLLRIAIFFIGRAFPVSHRGLDATAGALLGALYGSCMAIVLVWGGAFLMDAFEARTLASGNRAQQKVAQVKSVPPLVTFARRMMAIAIAWNFRQLGASDETARFAAVYAEQPQELLQLVQGSVRSPEFKQLVSSESVREMVLERDAHAVQKSPEFARLIAQPAVQNLRQLMATDGKPPSDAQLAEQLVDAWARVEAMKSQPEVAALINDAEVQTFLRNGGAITPSLLVKGQQLLTLVSRQEPQVTKSQRDQPSQIYLYQWHDESGQLQITDYAGIPRDKLSQAKKIPL